MGGGLGIRLYLSQITVPVRVIISPEVAWLNRQSIVLILAREGCEFESHRDHLFLIFFLCAGARRQADRYDVQEKHPYIIICI